MIAATFMTVNIGDHVMIPFKEPEVRCTVRRKDEDKEWLELECADGSKFRLTADEFNDLGYIYA